MTTALVFQNTQFDIVDRNNQPWLRGLQVASALGYKNPTADIQNLYARNADEFTDSMTALVKLPTAGGEQETRIFSLRGAHLLAMLSRTAIAKEFRRWVLDILDRETKPAISERHAIAARENGKKGGRPRKTDVATVQQPHIVPVVMTPEMRNQRWLVSFDDNGEQQVKAVPHDACVMSPERMLKAINEPNGMYVRTELLFDFAIETMKRLGSRAAFVENQNLQLRQAR